MDELTIDMLPIEEAGPTLWYGGGGDNLSQLEYDILDRFDTHTIQLNKLRKQFEKMKKVADYLTMLKLAGYYKGLIDGIWGRQTDAADKQYKKDVSGKGNKVVVQRGDTLSKIANRYGVTVEQIMAINPEIKDSNKIWVDLVINLPSFILKPSENNTSSKLSLSERAYENSASPFPEVVDALNNPRLINRSPRNKANNSSKSTQKNTASREEDEMPTILQLLEWPIQLNTIGEGARRVDRWMDQLRGFIQYPARTYSDVKYWISTN